MDIINLNVLLDREQIASKILSFLHHFDENKNDLTIKRGIYIYGEPGSGKTMFVKKLLKENNYDILSFDAGDIRNKSVIETITKHNMADTNIMSTFSKRRQQIAIIMDEIDGMNSGDKGGINTLIKLIRPKKTKKQKKEDITNSPIICISNYHSDKKIKELMKVCNVYELPHITPIQIQTITSQIMPDINQCCKKYIATNIQGDLRRLSLLSSIYNKNPTKITLELLKTILFPKCYNDDTKKMTSTLFNNSYKIEDHCIIMNETDRTIVGLLWHENIIDLLVKMKDKKESIKLYLQFLDNICFSDYIDRITFQKQIWQFNELSSLIKTFYNSYILHSNIGELCRKNVLSDIRFTKVLTKYSTEYNNSNFIQNLCQQIGMDKKDMIMFFKSISQEENNTWYSILFDNYEITKLDINRITRYLDKHVIETSDKLNMDLGEDYEIDNL